MTKARLGIALCLAGLSLVAWRVSRWRRAAGAEIPREADLAVGNREFYDALWKHAKLVPPHRFNTWPLIRSLLSSGPRLEVGPGLRPRLPLEGADFVDASAIAVRTLCAGKGRAVPGSVESLPYSAEHFELVCAFDIVEHAADGTVALRELARVTKPDGVLILAVPLHAAAWTAFDDFVGHRERYEPDDLVRQLASQGFEVKSSAVYGMQPRWPGLAEFGIRCLLQRRERAMWYYTNFFMPIGLWFQRPLRLRPGLIPTAGVDEILLVCRKK